MYQVVSDLLCFGAVSLGSTSGSIGRLTHYTLRRRKEIISVDNKTGGKEEFVAVEVVSVGIPYGTRNLMCYIRAPGGRRGRANQTSLYNILFYHKYSFVTCSLQPPAYSYQGYLYLKFVANGSA